VTEGPDVGRQHRGGIAWRLRGFLFTTALAGSLVVYVPFLLLFTFTPLRVRHRLSNVWTRFFVAFIGAAMGIRHRVRGMERLPDEACIYFVKHQSTWETLAFQTLFPHYVWILKREALWIPFFGWGLALLRPIAIDRSAGRAAVEQIIEQGGRRLSQGLGILIFPEGTRIAPKARHRYGLSGVLLAQATGAPMVPIAHNSGLFWPPKRLGGYRPGTIDVVSGEPVRVAPDEDPQAVTERLREWMDTTADRLADRADFTDKSG